MTNKKRLETESNIIAAALPSPGKTFLVAAVLLVGSLLLHSMIGA